MLKNKLYPYVEKYINEYLYGFTKEQLDVGLTNGTISLEYLNLRPDKVNSKLDEKNLPIWLKAGLISKISVGLSLMNFIGEQPLDVTIDGIDVIVTPSYKWIIKNLESFIEENETHIKDYYDPNENNSIDIFTKKVNIFDNSIFKQQVILEIFKDRSKIAAMINKIFKVCFKFYYMKNYLINAKIKNVHIRFEDDQLINYLGDIALGFKISNVEINLSAEGIMKRNSFKVDKLDVYWESKPKILIPSDVLNNSTDNNNHLDDKYYTMLKKLNFGKFSYAEGTKFLVQNFNFMGKFGTQSLNSGNMDLFKRDNNYKFYIQFASSELNLNMFPDLLGIFTDFMKFFREFSVIEQVQDFKPMKKPYNRKNPIVKEMLKFCAEHRSEILAKNFMFKKKMLVRDWLYYFYWCRKCNSSIYGKTISPLRLEFSRFYNLCFEGIDDGLNNSIDLKKEKDKENGTKRDNVSSSVADSQFGVKKSKATDENPYPDNINMSFQGDFLVKGINVHLHTSINNNKDDFVTMKIEGFDIKSSINKDQCDVNVNMKSFGFGPSSLIKGERVIISNNNAKRNVMQFNPMMMGSNVFIPQQQKGMFNIPMRTEENSHSDILKKNNPFYIHRMKILNETLNKVGDSQENNKVAPVKSSQRPVKNSSFIASILSTNDTPKSNQEMMQKQQKEMSISKAIFEYNLRKKASNPVMGLFQQSYQPVMIQQRAMPQQSSVAIKSDPNQIIPLNLLEVYSQQSKHSISLSLTKSNIDSKADSIKVSLGVIRLNLFAEYVASCLSIISEFSAKLKKPQIKVKNNKMTQGLKVQKQLMNMKKYIYNYLIKLPESKKTEQIKEYITYLQKEINQSTALITNSENFEINYLFSMFSKGIDFNLDYENFECVYYKKGIQGDKSHKILGKAVVPQIGMCFKLTLSRIFVKFFDFEFEINDLENSKNLMTTLFKILEEKLKTSTIFIEPCLRELRAEIEKKTQDQERGLEVRNPTALINDEHHPSNNTHGGITLNLFNNKKESKKELAEDPRGITYTLQENEYGDEEDNSQNHYQINNNDLDGNVDTSQEK